MRHSSTSLFFDFTRLQNDDSEVELLFLKSGAGVSIQVQEFELLLTFLAQMFTFTYESVSERSYLLERVSS